MQSRLLFVITNFLMYVLNYVSLTTQVSPVHKKHTFVICPQGPQVCLYILLAYLPSNNLLLCVNTVRKPHSHSATVFNPLNAHWL